MRSAVKKTKKRSVAATEIISARLPKPGISILRKIYPGCSNQAIIETLVEEKLARKDFDSWLGKLNAAHQSGDLDLDKV
ncbi:hypothetical protein WDW86_15590 [Bdellovibrionota bacterium FG-2]